MNNNRSDLFTENVFEIKYKQKNLISELVIETEALYPLKYKKIVNTCPDTLHSAILCLYKIHMLHSPFKT